MSLVEEFKKIYTESRRMQPLFWITALIFSFLGYQQTGIPKNQNFVFLQMLFDAFKKGVLAQLMSIITCKALQYMNTANTERRVFAAIGLTVIHVIWIFWTNICFTCMLTKLEMIISYLEFFVLLVIGAFVLQCVITVLSNIWVHLHGVVITQDESPPSATGNLPDPHGDTSGESGSISGAARVSPRREVHRITQDESPPSETGILSNPLRDTTQPIAQDLTSTSNTASHGAVSGESASNFGAAGVSQQSGIPFCHHNAPSRSSVTTLRKMGPPTASRQAQPKNSHQRNLSSPPNEGPQLNSEWELFESKTRSGKVYNAVKLNRSSGFITKA